MVPIFRPCARAPLSHSFQLDVAPIILGDAEALRFFAFHRPDVGQRPRIHDDVAAIFGPAQ